MQLFWSRTSPFVRKVMACAIVRGIDARIEQIAVDPWAEPDALVRRNPFSKVPLLVTDDGMVLHESVLICEYLDSIGDAPPMFPAAGAPRWQALMLHANANSMIDASLIRRLDSMRPSDPDREKVEQAQSRKIIRALDLLEQQVPAATPDIGTLTLGAALGYLDFRFANDAWRRNRPNLAAWFNTFRALPAMQRTEPA